MPADYGFTGSAWSDWREQIADEIFVEQSIVYWLRAFIADTERNQHPVWDESNLTGGLIDIFGMSPDAAYKLVRSLPVSVLLSQSQAYWAREWVREHEQAVSRDFQIFVAGLSADQVYEYTEGDSDNSDIGAGSEAEDEGGASGEDGGQSGSGGDDDEDDDDDVDSIDSPDAADAVRIPVIKSGGALRATDLSLVHALLRHANRPVDGRCWYHTTDWAGGYDIAVNGIDQSRGQTCQDFGGRTSSYYLNHEWHAAVDWGVQRFPRNTAILVYDLSDALASHTDKTLDLTEDPRLWSRVVRASRSGKANDSDGHRFVIGPQAKNGKDLIKNKTAAPKKHDTLQQTAVKGNAASTATNQSLIGVILTNQRGM
ncbi:hypothetical protein HDU87_007692 [Geranomyces variabilis]|uniref:Uncharacterized protein n=1 Tax=Geranomyces variabilis TaxID=109894 RepID=A0AAD5TDM0_9FUNG|nr:hypothetical protein HDU87_007692 [Geranomyces variabilis]